MPGIIEFPTLVQQAVERFGAVFANEPERRHFAEYLTGLLVAEKKNVSGINAEFAQTTDQSCLNRWITEVGWEVRELNRQRLAGLQQDPATRYARSGIIPIDNTLIDHDGKLIEDVGYFWDHAEQRHKIAHDYLIVNYVCPSGKHYALEFRRFRKREDCEAKQAELAAEPGGYEAASGEEQKYAWHQKYKHVLQERLKLPGTWGARIMPIPWWRCACCAPITDGTSTGRNRRSSTKSEWGSCAGSTWRQRPNQWPLIAP